MKERENSTGRLLSKILRHEPALAGVRLDRYGWANVDELVKGIQKKQSFSRARLEEIVRTDKKERYSFDSSRTRIRANYGHSIPVEPVTPPQEPPEFLWHGSASKFTASIQREGLRPGSRLYVHLSSDLETARTVGERHGTPVIYRVLSGRMFQDGHLFYPLPHGMWMTKAVPRSYLRYDPSV